MIRNGVVRITRHYQWSKDDGQDHTGTAHVHDYATSVILNDINPDDVREKNLVIAIVEGNEPSITFEHVGGQRKGRKAIFEPQIGDDVGWDEMMQFARRVEETLST